MRQLNFNPHLTGWWSPLKGDSRADTKPQPLKLVNILLEGCV